MNQKIEMGKTYRTRDGREVRIYAVDVGPSRSVHGTVKMANEEWEAYSWKSDGTYFMCPGAIVDLIEVRQKITRTYWLAHYPDGITLYEQLYKPVDTAAIAITGPHEVTFTEGEGL